MNKQLLVIAPSHGVECTFYLIVAETGEVLNSHFCSHEGYALYDLWEGRQELKDQVKARFGEVDIVRVDRSFIGTEELLKKNKKFYGIED